MKTELASFAHSRNYQQRQHHYLPLVNFCLRHHVFSPEFKRTVVCVFVCERIITRQYRADTKYLVIRLKYPHHEQSSSVSFLVTTASTLLTILLQPPRLGRRRGPRRSRQRTPCDHHNHQQRWHQNHRFMALQ